MRLNKKILTIISLIYIYIPVILFLWGWTNIPVFIACLLIISFCLFFAYVKCISKAGTEEIVVDPVTLMFVVFLFLWIGYYAGWGRWADQSGDWFKHNAILYDLVNKKWPVLYNSYGERSMLVYYIGQYLVPAVFGKITGSGRNAEVMLYVWNEIGLFLAYLHLILILKTNNYLKQFLTAVILPFFSIPLWISQYVMKELTKNNRLGDVSWFYWEGDIKLQYSSNYTLLRWVVPQVIVCWLIIELFFEYKDNIDLYLLFMLPGMLFGTLSFIGIVPFGFVYALYCIFENEDKLQVIKKIFSIENLLLLFSLGVVLILYYYGNITAEKPEEISFRLMPYNSDKIVYLIFVAVNILIYFWILFRDNMKDPVFYIMTASLCILPFFTMGRFNDLVMRTSIPGLFVLMVYVLKYVFTHYGSNEEEETVRLRISKIIVVVFLVTGLYYPFNELTGTVQSENFDSLGFGYDWTTMEKFANRTFDESDDLKYNYYAYDLENNLFYRYLIRK